ncbi:hypothetical protein [Streptomyces reniochalinae]|uniref:Toxin-antitoxin system HicB family antitoxin n=1 Tax=Streptomyces reniochalinae TaxID=2250578 RepID=A0A367EX35_9ACTN|nr:hypothetical protein DQ392_06555 [Streptomyces reniochalinae]
MTDDGENAASGGNATSGGNAASEEGAEAAAEPEGPQPAKGRPRQRKQVLLRLDPAMHDALARWAADELRSTNAQIDYLLRQALKEAGRLPSRTRPHPRRGRPPRED